ncbi:MAG: glycosyltransferase family 4 protein [Planctomycetaceae bacterium]|nr:glycosyltransferase family 4 protein [Planctomycetaceae bacterium]
MTKRSKCLFLSCYFPPPFVGGSLVYYYNLLSKCTSDEVVVVTTSAENSAEFDSGVPYKIVRNPLVPISEGRRLKRFLWPLVLCPLLIFWILRYRASTVHINSARMDMIGAWLATRLTRCKLLVSVLGEELAVCSKEGIAYRAARARPWISWLRNLHDRIAIGLLRRCDGVMTCSYFTKRLVAAHGVPEERIVVITPGVDTAKVACQPAIAPELAARLAGRRLLLTVGTFIERKGQEMVLQALPQVVQRFPDVMYVAAGHPADIPYRDRCRATIAEHGLQDHAMILENLDNEAIAWLYSSCDVFVMPNRTLPNGDTEGYGIVFLEAGAWGKPVIGGRAGGAVDAVDEGTTGLLVDGANVDEIAEAISRLLSDGSLAQRLGEGGRQKVKRSGWDAKADAYCQFLEQFGDVPVQMNRTPQTKGEK